MASSNSGLNLTEKAKFVSSVSLYMEILRLYRRYNGAVPWQQNILIIMLRKLTMLGWFVFHIIDALLRLCSVLAYS